MVKGKKATTNRSYHAFPILGKKGEELTTPIIVSLLLTILVFSVLFTFVSQASSGALVYEKIYVKQIAFLLDGAKKNTDITVDFTKAIAIAKKNGISEENLKNLVEIKDNTVKVSLRGNSGQSMKYFSDYLLVSVIDENKLIIRIREKLNE